MAFRNSLSPLSLFYPLLPQEKKILCQESEFNLYSVLGTFVYNKLLMRNPVKGGGGGRTTPTPHCTGFPPVSLGAGRSPLQGQLSQGTDAGDLEGPVKPS